MTDHLLVKPGWSKFGAFPAVIFTYRYISYTVRYEYLTIFTIFGLSFYFAGLATLADGRKPLRDKTERVSSLAGMQMMIL